jgi:PAS domain S-box-containing protein
MNASAPVSPSSASAAADLLLQQLVEQWAGIALLFDAQLRLRASSASARGVLSAPLNSHFSELDCPWPLKLADLERALAGQMVKIEPEALTARDSAGLNLELWLHPLTDGSGGNAVLCLIDVPSTLRTPSWRDEAFGAADVGSWRCNFLRGHTEIDPEWCAQLKLALHGGPDLLEQWTRQIHPDDVTDYRRRLIDLQLGSITRFEAEYRVLTSDNRWLWILQRGQITVRSPQGEPLEAAGICMEIDQRKRQENLLRLNESRLATALWGARAAFWQWHVPTDVRSPSPMWFAMTGYTREHWEGLGNPWREHIHPEDWPRIEQAMRRYWADETDSLEYEYRVRTAAGEWKWLLDRGRAVEWDLENKPAVIMGVALDVDIHKRTEAALRESESQLQTAIWGAGIGLWEVKFNQPAPHWFNDWWDRHGISPHMVSVDPAVRRPHVHPEDFASSMARLSEHLAGQVDQYDIEYRVQTGSGEWRWIFERGRVSLRGESGEPLSLAGICLDIDKHKRR